VPQLAAQLHNAFLGKNEVAFAEREVLHRSCAFDRVQDGLINEGTKVAAAFAFGARREILYAAGAVKTADILRYLERIPPGTNQ
jgi:hypothetical protein